MRTVVSFALVGLAVSQATYANDAKLPQIMSSAQQQVNSLPMIKDGLPLSVQSAAALAKAQTEVNPVTAILPTNQSPEILNTIPGGGSAAAGSLIGKPLNSDAKQLLSSKSPHVIAAGSGAVTDKPLNSDVNQLSSTDDNGKSPYVISTGVNNGKSPYVLSTAVNVKNNPNTGGEKSVQIASSGIMNNGISPYVPSSGNEKSPYVIGTILNTIPGGGSYASGSLIGRPLTSDVKEFQSLEKSQTAINGKSSHSTGFSSQAITPTVVQPSSDSIRKNDLSALEKGGFGKNIFESLMGMMKNQMNSGTNANGAAVSGQASNRIAGSTISNPQASSALGSSANPSFSLDKALLQLQQSNALGNIPSQGNAGMNMLGSLMSSMMKNRMMNNPSTVGGANTNGTISSGQVSDGIAGSAVSSASLGASGKQQPSVTSGDSVSAGAASKDAGIGMLASLMASMKNRMMINPSSVGDNSGNGIKGETKNALKRRAVLSNAPRVLPSVFSPFSPPSSAMSNSLLQSAVLQTIAKAGARTDSTSSFANSRNGISSPGNLNIPTSQSALSPSKGSATTGSNLKVHDVQNQMVNGANQSNQKSGTKGCIKSCGISAEECDNRCIKGDSSCESKCANERKKCEDYCGSLISDLGTGLSNGKSVNLNITPANNNVKGSDYLQALNSFNGKLRP